MNPRLIIAHKGASAYAPENTLLSFKKAWQLKADMIELDVHETADGCLVCIHDSTIDRTTNGSGKVSSMSLAEIQAFDAGEGEQIPLLEDVLRFAKGKMQVNIEIKVVGAEEKLVQLVNNIGIHDSVIVSSFIHVSLSEIREIDERILIAILVSSIGDNLATYASDLGAYAINPRKDSVTSGLIESAHDLDIKVFPWTVNEENTMRKLFNLGVDGLITDYPDLGVKLIRSEFVE